MSEAKLVDFFDREYSEPPTGLDRAHMDVAGDPGGALPSFR